MKSDNWFPMVFMSGLVLANITFIYSQETEKAGDFSDKAETERVERTAKQLPYLNLGTTVQSAAEGNMVGVRSEDVTFSRRLDSRTFFAQDRRYGITKKAGVFAGSDEELQKLARTVLIKLDIPPAEMARMTVLREK